jgi:lipopolysaccharide transport system permease protein
MTVLKELYNYREMIYNLVKKDLRGRYKGSVLGFLWTFVNPLLQLIVYTLVFSTIMRINVDKFYMYLFIALIPWIFFTTSILGGTVSIIQNKDLIKKIYFPRIVIPISTVLATFMNMVFSMIVVIFTLFISGIGISYYILLLPVIMILEFFLVLGMVFLFSSLNVFFRDIEHILSIIMMIWFYMTPIVYTVEMIPEKYKPLFYLNPMTNIIIFYRDILFYKKMPSFGFMGGIFLYSIIMIVIGFLIFQKLQKNFVEEL